MYFICDEGADPYPSTPKELEDRYVHLYGLAAFNQNYLGHSDKPIQ